MFLGTAINNSKIEFCKIDGPDKFLFSVDKVRYCTNVRLTSTATRGPWAPLVLVPHPVVCGEPSTHNL